VRAAPCIPRSDCAPRIPSSNPASMREKHWPS
jgi:hypothetical protein